MMHNVPMERVGTQVINKVRVPVYALPNGQYVQQNTAAGSPILISVEGAKTLKNGQYPFHKNVEAVSLRSVVNDEQPFVLRSTAARQAGSKELLRVLMDRLIETGTQFTFSEN